MMAVAVAKMAVGVAKPAAAVAPAPTPNSRDLVGSHPSLSSPRLRRGRPRMRTPEKTRRKLARIEAFPWLAETNPLVFGPAVKPLAIGVSRKNWPQTKAAGIKRQALNDALKRRTSSVAYLDSLAVDNAARCDLDGRAIEPVNSEHQPAPARRRRGHSRSVQTSASEN